MRDQTPTPTPEDIATVIAGIKDGTDSFLQWCKLDREAEQDGRHARGPPKAE